MSRHEIVILGANMGGVPLAHFLLRETIPQLTALDPAQTYHVTQISPNSHYYWKIAAPRALINPELIPSSTLLKPIADSFKRYRPEQYTHVQGTATGVDATQKSVSVSLADGSEKKFAYSTLIVVTGMSYNSNLWTVQHGHGEVVAALEALHATLPTAKSVLVAGGGPVGVETSGEIAYTYRSAQTTILSGDKKLLTRLTPRTSAAAETMLKKLGVVVRHGLRVTSAKKLDDGRTEVQFSDGSAEQFDVYVDATGGRPNTGFLPESWLQNHRLLTDGKTLRATAPGAEGVYGLGDAASYSSGMSINAMDGIKPVASSIAIDIMKARPESEKQKKVGTQQRGLVAYLLSLFGGKDGVEPVAVPFKTMEDTQMVPIGMKGGVGQVKGWRIPSMMVYMFKGKDYMVRFVPGMLDGTSVTKA